MLPFLFLFTSCSDGIKKLPAQKKERKVIAIIFDLSRSTLNARSTYLRNFNRVLNKLEQGDYLIVTEALGNSLGGRLVTEERIPLYRLPLTKLKYVPQESKGNPMIEKKVEKENKKIKKNSRNDFNQNVNKIRRKIYDEIRRRITSAQSSGTDLFGSLEFISRSFSKTSTEKKILIIFSDMIVETKEYNFRKNTLSTKDIAQIIEREKDRLPNLSGATILVVGPPGDLRNQKKFYDVRSFWKIYFKTSGADLDINNYGAVLTEPELDSVFSD